jgi:uncharacterized membrane protein YkvA (DUF1232 family)
MMFVEPLRLTAMNFSIQSIYNWYRGLLQNPQYRWWVVGASIVYLVSPFDISPDVFPIVGWIDDTIVIGLLVAELSQLASAKLKEKSVRVDETTATAPVTPNSIDVNAVSVE